MKKEIVIFNVYLKFLNFHFPFFFLYIFSLLTLIPLKCLTYWFDKYERNDNKEKLIWKKIVILIFFPFTSSFFHHLSVNYFLSKKEGFECTTLSKYH